MDNSIIEQLRRRIATEPSVLFFGQDYLSSKTGHNPFYDVANHKLCGGKLSAKTDFSELWQTINDGNTLTPVNLYDLEKILQEIPEQGWLRKILGMRWSMVFTSAVDAAMFQCVGENFVMTPVSMEQRLFNRSYITKDTLHVSVLFGSLNGGEDNPPPVECTKRFFTSVKKKINDRLDWIYSNILTSYGVLIIDGWDPDRDWLRNLLEEAGEMPDQSIYLFGATQQVLENEDVKYLLECGILQADQRTLAQSFEEIGFFEEDDWEEESVANESGRMITLINAGERETRVLLSSNALARLDSHITVLYDDIWIGKDDKGIELEKQYAQFLSQTDQPIWHLYSKRYDFYFNRTQDKTLIRTVEKEMRNSSYKRKYIMLEGYSNTGKTASLVKLAYVKRNDVPVIYICGIPDQVEWMEHLKNFIKTQFMESLSVGKAIDTVLVIWDANTDYNAAQRCKQLQDVLRECNVIVVGSAYLLQWRYKKSNSYCTDTAGNHHLLLTAELDGNEIKGMLASIRKINPDIYQKLNNSVNRTTTQLLYLLQKMVRLKYMEEWKQVGAVLEARFHREVDSSEEYADEKLEKYRESMAERVEEEIMRKGIASSWQLQLEQIKKKYFNVRDMGREKKEKLDGMERLEARIKSINRILAVSGKFSVDLPLTLVLRMVSEGKQRIFSEERLFLMDVIANDSLLRSERRSDGYLMVNFRHPSEAELYIKKNLGESPDERKSNEVELLKGMIRECRWNDEMESLPVLALVRCFGPNSWGTLDHPKEERRRYKEYATWWREIALELQDASDKQSESILVYAFLIRNSCRDRLEKLKKGTDSKEEGRNRFEKEYIDELGKAREELRSAIETHDQYNKYQYCRLLGEICSNLVFEMQYKMSECENNFWQLKDYFLRAVKNWSDNNSQNLFTKNSLLDIWLNGVEHYFTMKVGNSEPMRDPECASVVADSIHYIDELLDLTEEGFDRAKLLDKVNHMYDMVGGDRLESFEEKFSKSNNDTFLYLMAWKCWQLSPELKESLKDSDDYINNIVSNLYLLPDDLDRREDHQEKLGKLKEHAKCAAKNAIRLLEKNRKLIESSRSTRCIQMLIRAKWLVYTGNMPLETKQYPSLNADQWKEMGELCEKYIRYADRKGERLRMAPVLFRMIYVWCFTRDKTEFESLRNRQNMLSTNDWYFERICLCDPGTDVPKQFKINLQLKRGTENKYVATIVSSLEENGAEKRDIVGSNIHGKQVHVPVAIAQQLLGNVFGSEKYNVSQPIIVWFNAKGPQIGLQRQKGGK